MFTRPLHLLAKLLIYCYVYLELTLKPDKRNLWKYCLLQVFALTVKKFADSSRSFWEHFNSYFQSDVSLKAISNKPLVSV